MKVLKDIWSSVSENSKAKVADPIIGTFIASWALCNWDKLILLVIGQGTINDRVHAFSEGLSISKDYSKLWQDFDLLIIPALLTIFYIFLLPSISLRVRRIQKRNIVDQHSDVIDIDCEKINKQKELNKARLRANPNKPFLESEVNVDLQILADKAKRRAQLTEYWSGKIAAKKSEWEQQQLRLELEKMEVDKIKFEYEKKSRAEEREKASHELRMRVINSSLASNRFPAAYSLLQALNESLGGDGVKMSLQGLSNTFSAVFGYSTFEHLINDNAFNNKEIEQCKYIYHNAEQLGLELDRIVSLEDDDNLSPDLLFDHIQNILYDSGFKFGSIDVLVESLAEELQIDSINWLQDEGLSGAMAQTDTIFDEIYIELNDYTYNNNELVMFMSGNASGDYRKDSGVEGQDLDFKVKATCSPKIGRNWLSEPTIEFYDVHPS